MNFITTVLQKSVETKNDLFLKINKTESNHLFLGKNLASFTDTKPQKAFGM